MDWYYAIGKEKQGPFVEEAFKSLVDDGTIKSETLVWNRTMTDWEQFRKVDAPHLKMNQLRDQRIESVTDPVVDKDTIGETCSECGKSFSQDDLVSFNDSFVCAQCKPFFFAEDS